MICMYNVPRRLMGQKSWAPAGDTACRNYGLFGRWDLAGSLRGRHWGPSPFLLSILSHFQSCNISVKYDMAAATHSHCHRSISNHGWKWTFPPWSFFVRHLVTVMRKVVYWIQKLSGSGNPEVILNHNYDEDWRLVGTLESIVGGNGVTESLCAKC